MTSIHDRRDVRIFQKECSSLSSNGFEVFLIVNDNKADEIKNDVKIISTGFKPKNRKDRFLHSNNKILKKALDIDAEIYHFHDPDLLSVGLKLKKKGKKVIFDSHENYTEQIKIKSWLPKFLRKSISKAYYNYETYVCKKIDGVIFPCTMENGRNVFENRSNKTTFINNVPILDEFRYFNDYSHKKDSFKLCYSGALTYNRGITHLVKAAYRSNVKLILCGKFNPPEYFDELKSMTEFSCVEFKGFLDRNELIDTYINSNVGCCTILNVGQHVKTDNLGTKVYEYMMMGLPVILSDYPYGRKLMNDYNFGVLVKPDDFCDISRAIDFLINNHEKARKMGNNGRKLVLDKFNWEIEEKKLIDFYKSI